MTTQRASALGRAGWYWAVCLMALLLAACAQAPRVEQPGAWSGRMALRVQDDAGASFSALFVLQGDPERGSLTLSTPLGTVLAALRWAPGQAALQSPQGDRTADSLDALLADALGSTIPVPALFAWLRGEAASAEGWEVDLGEIGSGRLAAVRQHPAPSATLRIALDR